jgi:Tfp pilus assembly protein PilF
MALGSKWDKVELAPSILIGSMTRLFKHHWFVLHLILLACCLAGCGDRSDTGSDATAPASNPIPEKFFQLMNRGKNYLDQGDTSNALNTYREAADLVSNDPDVHLNLANVHLLSGEGDAAVHEADLALELEPQSAAAYFVKGSAFLRLQRPEDAVKALTNSLSIDPGVTAAFFQLGLARMELEQWEEAITAFREGIRLDPNRLHSSAHYLLARSLIRVGKQEEAQKELEMHQANVGGEGPSMGDAVFERCKHTRARIPFRLDQPDAKGIQVQFVDATDEVLGNAATRFSGPVGVVDLHPFAWMGPGLVATEPGKGFQLLSNQQGIFRANESNFLPATDAENASKILIGDFQNDRVEDVLVLGSTGSHLYQLGQGGLILDVTSSSGLEALKAETGLLMDLDFTGKLDIVAVSATDHGIQIWRQSSPWNFSDITDASGLVSGGQPVQQVWMEDWNRDQVMDIIASRAAGVPILHEKQRGGKLMVTEPERWDEGSVFCMGDFDNDLRPDLAVLGQGSITLCYNGGEQRKIDLAINGLVRQIVPVDFDNDGWLDLWTIGDRVRAWRNRGLAGFEEQTTTLGLDSHAFGTVLEIHFADFDRDCDQDAILSLAEGGLRYLRNNGGNTNGQIRVTMKGNRSNASGIGCKIEIATGGLRLTRTVHQLPVEIGVGNHQVLDSFLVHWFNWPQGSAEVPVNCQEPLLALELTIQEGSCPYLYAWDGETFRFVTDFLGAAPLGLPVAEGRYVEADPEELVWIGDEHTFVPKDGSLQLSITEELREVLYLDEAKLVVVDREPDTEVHSTDKLIPFGPFPLGSIMTLHHEYPLRRAENHEGLDVTEELRSVDGHRASPPHLRTPQLRGLAQQHSWILDFGPLDTSKPLVLVANGWIRFGGGMANIAGSLDPELPFPFPTLEVETAPGIWAPVHVTVGAPAGKSKTIVVNLEGKLPKEARWLKLTSAFEIHWDRIALMEKKPTPRTTITYFAPSETDLHYRGYSRLLDLPPDAPLTPDYDDVLPNPNWTLLPSGWSTRYGDVSELIAKRDEGLLLVHSGDELILRFETTSLPSKPEGTIREYFLYADGWDKDSDFHVNAGSTIEPLPFHGMDDQRYGQQERPAFPSDALHRKYHTRWVEGNGLTLKTVFRTNPAVEQTLKSN